MDTLRIACCGGWHSHAVDFPKDRAARFCADLPYEIAVAWDDNEARGKAFAAELGVPFEPDFDALCADPTIQGFIITAGTTRHAALITRAARAGKHIFTEKALTVDPEEAEALRKVVKESGIHFTISDPVEKPELVLARRLMDAGTFGEVTEIRYRTVHSFALTDPELMTRYYQKDEGGYGALADMGHHAVHVLYWFLGKPCAATGAFQRFSVRGKAHDIDDSAAALFTFPSGAIGVAETGWLCPGGQNIFELFGTKGYLRWDCDGIRWRFDQNRDWVRAAKEDLPAGPVYPLRYWMESVLNDTPNTQYTIDEAADVAEIVCAAYQHAI